MNSALKPVPGFNGYFADELGQIISFWGKGKSGLDLTGKPHLLVPGNSSNGKYFSVVIRSNCGVLKTKTVHILVCSAFHGLCPDNHEVSHEDGNGKNNKPKNLKWRTRSENHKLKVVHGTDDRGFRNSRNVIKTKERLLEIKDLLAKGVTRAAIARKFSVSRVTIIRIAQGRRYGTYT